MGGALGPSRRAAVGLAIVSLLSLCIASSWHVAPFSFTRPPVTRRTGEYQIAYPSKASCGYNLNLGKWTRAAVSVPGNCTEQPAYPLCSSEAVRRWEWAAAARACLAHSYDVNSARALLSGKWVACVGDSIARSLCAALMVALEAPAASFVYERHADFERNLHPGVKMTFHWSPFPENSTALVGAWRHTRKPDFVVLTTALWHMLYTTGDAGLYAARLRELRAATEEMLPKRRRGKPPPLVVVASAPEVYPQRMVSAAKRAAMTPAAVDAYNQALANSGLLAREGPYGLLDMFALTHGCRLECSADGVHSKPAVYGTAAQLLLNMVQQCSLNASCWLS